MMGAYKNGYILTTVSSIELKPSQNVSEGVSYAVEQFQGCQGYNDITMGANDNMASQKWENTLIFLLISSLKSINDKERYSLSVSSVHCPLCA